MPVTLVWFRSDLRIHDNTALYHAARRGPVIGVFLHAEQQWREHGHGDNKLDFLCRGVEALGEALAERNIPLIQRQVPRFDDAPQALMALAEELGAELPEAGKFAAARDGGGLGTEAYVTRLKYLDWG